MDMDMEVAGRHALLFDDDAMAAFVNSEDALVEWHSLKIDRYDVRHLLSAPPPSRRRNRSHEPRASDDPAVEFLIDQERYLDLPSESYQPELEGEEEEKPSSSGGYRAVAFSYGNTGGSADQENTDVGMEARGFLPPFSVPGDIVQSLPPTEKIHQIIARTAIFVSKHGGQTEIILRVKQGDNPTFGFLMPDHHLHAYFRYLVDHPELLHTETDEKSQDERKTAGTEHSESGSVGGALSLLGSAYGSGEDEDEGGDHSVNASLPHDTKKMEPVETAAKDESLSRKLILSNKDKVPAVKKNSSIIGSKPKSVKANKKEDNSALSSAKEEKLRNHGVGATSKPVLEPPQELKRLIDKLVEFVMRNGRQFEATLLEQDSKLERFPFLLSSDQYHPYYLKALEAAQESKVNGKISYPGQDDLGGRGISRKTSMVKDEFSDVPFESDRKEKFKMVIGKSKKEAQEAQETEKESHESGFTVDAAAAAAILQAASKGMKSSGLRFITNTAPNSHDNAILKQDANFGSHQPKTIAGTSSHGVVLDDDSSYANMTEEQKVKAERLKRAKMFVAMLKSGALPSRTGTSRGSSAEPVELGMLKSAPEASSAGLEREGSLAPAVVEKPADEGNFIERHSERQSKRKYRSRSVGIEDDEEDSHREGHSNRKHRSTSRNPEGDEDEIDRKNYQEKGRHRSHSIEENKNEGESGEEKICREEREGKDNESYSEIKYKSRSRSHREDDKVGKDLKYRRKRHRSRSSSEESDNGEGSDGQDTEHKKYRSKHHRRQRDKNESEGTYKEEGDKEHRRSYKSRDRRQEGSRKTENTVEGEDKHYKRKHSSHSSSEESVDELDHHHSKSSSHSKHKENHRKEEKDHKRSKKSRHSHHSSSESPSRHKKHRSSHTSHHRRDKHSRHRNVHSSSKDKESHQYHHKHDSSSDEEHKPRARKESHDLRVELEEGEISPKDEPKATVSGDGKRGTPVDIITSSETTEVPADLRAKIRAMLMATRS